MLEWIPAASFVLTGAAMVWRMSAVASSLGTLLTLLTERVNHIDDRLQYIERLPRPDPAPLKKSRKPSLSIVRKPR